MIAALYLEPKLADLAASTARPRYGRIHPDRRRSVLDLKHQLANFATAGSASSNSRGFTRPPTRAARPPPSRGGGAPDLALELAAGLVLKFALPASTRLWTVRVEPCYL